MVISTLEDLMQMLKTQKIQSNEDGDTEKARHLALAYTDLEKVVAYLKVYVFKESES